MLNFIHCWMLTKTKDERGATAVEYGLMVSLVAMLIIGAVFLVGDELRNLFTDVNNELEAPTGVAD